MKRTNVSIFLDSNILIYCYSNSDFNKQKIARSLATAGDGHISTQVLNETVNVLNKKYGVKWESLKDLVSDFESNFSVRTVSGKDIKFACEIAHKYGFSFYDSLIVSSALDCNCTILYSEDLQHDQIIENKMKILNPFR